MVMQDELGFCGDFEIFTIGNKSASVGPRGFRSTYSPGTCIGTDTA